MIDPKLFTVEKLLATMLDTEHGNRKQWLPLVEIVPGYKAPFAREDDRPRCIVRCKTNKEEQWHWLRHSSGPRQEHFWDVYGDDYITPELALLAVVEAPIPPGFIDIDVWRDIRDAKRLEKL